jgi:hypothetical protein
MAPSIRIHTTPSARKTASEKNPVHWGLRASNVRGRVVWYRHRTILLWRCGPIADCPLPHFPQAARFVIPAWHHMPTSASVSLGARVHDSPRRMIVWHHNVI